MLDSTVHPKLDFMWHLTFIEIPGANRWSKFKHLGVKLELLRREVRIRFTSPRPVPHPSQVSLVIPLPHMSLFCHSEPSTQELPRLAQTQVWAEIWHQDAGTNETLPDWCRGLALAYSYV